MAQRFYITTAIHYVNDLPHIGQMYENIAADVMARHRRRMGDEVWFLTGTDERGDSRTGVFVGFGGQPGEGVRLAGGRALVLPPDPLWELDPDDAQP